MQPFGQHRIPFIDGNVPNSHRERFLRTHDYKHLLRAGHTRIDQIPLEHDVVRHEHGHHYNRILRPL